MIFSYGLVAFLDSVILVWNDCYALDVGPTSLQLFIMVCVILYIFKYVNGELGLLVGVWSVRINFGAK